MNVDPLTFVRSMEVLVSSLIVVLIGVRATLAWGDYSLGQKLIFTSWVAYMITATWDIFKLIDEEVPFSWRVIPFTVGMVCAVAYLLEPPRRFKRRLGQKDPMGKDGL